MVRVTLPHSVPAILHGLDLDRLFDEGLRRPRLPLRPGAWTPPEMEEVAPLLAGYQLVRLIGRGGMGAVYEARQPGLDRSVAIKLLPRELGADAGFAERFRREARTMARLQHPHIVAVFDSGETASGHLFFVMEYVDGGDVAAFSGLRPVAQALQVIAEIAHALEYAHAEGVVHRDIKPSNILLTQEGRVKVGDFGLAVLLDREDDVRLTLTGEALGTLEYAAPEQLSGTGATDARSDLYSLGVLAYELLAGKVPRGVFEPPSQLNAAAAPAVDAVILTALQSDPAHRYRTVADFRAALAHAQDLGAQQSAREREMRRRLLRRARVAGAFGAVALAALCAAAFGWWQFRAAEAHEAAARTQAVQARAQRDQAEKLVAFLVDELSDKLKDTGRVDLIEMLITQAERYYAQLPSDQLGAESRVRQAQLRLQRSFVQRQRGDLAGAIATAREAASMVEPLAEEAPENRERFLAALRPRDFLAILLTVDLQFEPALAERRALRQRIEAARTRFADDPGIVFRLARALRLEGEGLFHLGRLDEAEACQRAALRFDEELVAAHPGNEQYRIELATATIELGSITEQRQDLAATLEHFQRGLALYRPLLGTEHWSFERRYAFCAVLTRVARGLKQRKQTDAAEALLREAIPLIDEMKVVNPRSVPALSQEKWVFETLAQILVERGNLVEGEEAQKRSEAAARRLREVGTPNTK